MLTRSGVAAAVTALVLAAAGWWWRYEELVVLAVGTAVAVAVSVWAARTPTQLDITRFVPDPRVARGDPIKVEYRIANRRRRRSAPVTIVDRASSDADPAAAPEVVRVAVPAVERFQRIDVAGRIPTSKRGLFTVGPWAIERLDPLGLAIGRVASTVTSTIIVHPRVHSLGGPYGDMHSVQDEALVRRSKSDPLSGFVSLREYVDGDDPRLIHWPTSARTGTLMLREHVELRRPEFTVVLDTSDATGDGEQFAADFEEMVDVTASIAVHAIRSGVEVRLRTTSRDLPGAHLALEHETQVLDLLTPVAATDNAATVPLATTLYGQATTQRHGSMVVVVTGPRGPSQALGSVVTARLIRVGVDAVTAPGVELAVTDAAEFARRWVPWD
ncbi:MAG TPA: DUF58 domain-containing protein [Ilumatobacter sp.]|nr:DUF58 domain-containing protein [Ilumatobacter sp.]